MDTKMHIKICSWNCKGFRVRSEDVRILLRDETPHVLLLQETHLPSINRIKIPGYIIYRKDPVAGIRQGGLATIVAQNIPSREVAVSTNLQILATVVGAKPITICNTYLECGQNITQSELDALIPQVQRPFVMAGDFNAHNTLWGSTKCDTRGHLIETFIHDWGLYLHNTDKPTYMNASSGKLDSIDLMISTASLSYNSEFRVLSDLHGSDHFPLVLDLSPNNKPNSPSMRWSFRKADWTAFRSCLSKVPRFKQSGKSDIVTELLHFITTSILNAAQHAIPLVSNKYNKRLVPWWNKDCKKAIKERRKALSVFRKNASQENLIKYRKARAKCKFIIKEAKRASWRNYVSTMNQNTQGSEIWRKIKTLKGDRGTTMPTLKVGNSYESDPETVANILASHFAKVSSSNAYSTQFREIKEKSEEEDITFHTNQVNLYSYNKEFSLWELDTAINSLKLTAPGPDKIHNVMIKNLPTSFRLYILQLYNTLWTTHKYPDSWKEAILIPVPKPGKDSTIPTSYRPIAMTNTLGKLLEKMVNERLMWELEKRGLLSKYQNGFRKNKSTIDNLSRLTTYIQDGFVQGKETVGIFFDCEKAYDKTWRHLILKKLMAYGFKGHLPIFIKHFLKERRFRVKVGEKLSSQKIQENGVPQGAVLSVTLFIVAINDIVLNIPSCIEPLIFVDDLTILYRGKSWLSVAPILQISINKISKWASNNGFSFSPSKTVSVLFSKKRKAPNYIPLTLDNQPIPTIQEVKYLGLILDRKLNWKSHIAYTRTKCLRDLNVLRMIQSNKWGADRATLLRIYHQLTRSKIDYGCAIYGSAKEGDLKKLDVVHNTFIRLATGAFRTSPIDSLLAEANEPPLASRRDLFLLRYGCKLNRFPDNSASKSFLSTAYHDLYNSREHLPKSAGVRFKLLTNSLGSSELSTTQYVYPDLPPWLINQPKVNYLCRSQKKTDTLVVNYIQEYLKHRNKYAQFEPFFTDASKDSSGSGCAFVYKDTHKGFTCNKWSNINTIELEAICNAIKYAAHLNLKKIVLYTDSQSALLALNKLYTQNEVVARIRRGLNENGIDALFCWVPSHTGIVGNEKADHQAKAAITSGEKLNTLVTEKDLDQKLKEYVKQMWQRRWTESNNDKLGFLKPTLSDWQTCYRRSRIEEVVLTRLRIGHTRLTHCYLITKQDKPICTLCGQNLTVHHILCECTQLNDIRNQFQLPSTITAILQDDEKHIKILFEFLREIDILHNI